MAWLLLAIVVPPALTALVVAIVRPAGRRAIGWARSASALAAAAAVTAIVAVAIDGPLRLVADGDDGARIGLFADEARIVLAAMTMAVAGVVQAYARRALDGDPAATRFAALSSLLAAATTGATLAATGLGLVAAWIVAGATLVGLLGHRRGWPPATQAVRIARRTFAVGDAALLGAAVVALTTIGDLDLTRTGSEATALLDERLDLGVGSLDAATAIALLLVVAGATRSALIPFHRWLPATLAAPTPVSALLHAGVVNALGVLLVVTAPIYATSAPASTVVFALGTVTALWATAAMLVRTDTKGGLVWSTAGQMGFMAVQLAVGAFAAALFHIVGHAMYKAAAFLGAGGTVTSASRHRHVPHGTGTTPAPRVRHTLTVVVPAAATLAALWLLDPHLTAAATILVAVFGFCSSASALAGWLRRGALPAGQTIVVGIGGATAAAFAYVGGLKLFEGFVADAVPFETPATVGPNWLVAAIAVAALATLTVRFGRGAAADRLRRRLYTALLFAGTPAPATAAAPHLAAAPEGATAAARPAIPVAASVTADR